ncbi:MAG: hypothetical protein K9L28_08665 [Synergistales bacterium]|nr:hypothetical protein [Synergistales bacterium]
MKRVRLTSPYWIARVRERGGGHFRIEVGVATEGFCEAYESLLGLLWKPENSEEYSACEVADQADLTCWIHQDAFSFLDRAERTPEGEYLFFVGGVGRLRLAIEDGEA